ncbi:hypothetical protein L2E82_22700 [Cichorium intybus]|uniref:Uncharacterized protein n=1 Tax=Cichorium intybus TaxID=13427 RepID=A0ACB9DYS4_CICIN|nr:hypothetical protein L2E82_22700 [Cichorium intybus]
MELFPENPNRENCLKTDKRGPASKIVDLQGKKGYLPWEPSALLANGSNQMPLALDVSSSLFVQMYKQMPLYQGVLLLASKINEAKSEKNKGEGEIADHAHKRLCVFAISDEHEHRHDVLEVDPPQQASERGSDVLEVEHRCDFLEEGEGNRRKLEKSRIRIDRGKINTVLEMRIKWRRENVIIVYS